MNDLRRVTIIGLGLMGGSLAMALQEKSDSIITGIDASPEVMREAENRGVIHQSAPNLKAAVEDAALVVLAVPVGAYSKIIQEIGVSLREGTVVTDLGSVKNPALTAAASLPEPGLFIGGHPLAGSEKGGLAAATPYLFENAYYFLTPNEDTPEQLMNRMKTWVSTLGAFPIMVSATVHDRILARTSHFPHITASLLTAVIAEEDEMMVPFTGSGFRDTTRIASGNPYMWEEILYLNREELNDCLRKLEVKVKEMRQALRREDRQWMLNFLQNSKQFRDSLPTAGKDYLPAWYEIFVDIKDQPGALAAITGTLARAGVNIREIEIHHAREGDQGAVRIAFSSAAEEKAAMNALDTSGHSFARSRGEKNHVDNE